MVFRQPAAIRSTIDWRCASAIIRMTCRLIWITNCPASSPDQPVPDLATLSSLPSEDSEMLAAVLDGLSNFRNNLRADANMLMSKKVAPLLDAAERLRSRAGLTIGTVCPVHGSENIRLVHAVPRRSTPIQRGASSIRYSCTSRSRIFRRSFEATNNGRRICPSA